MCSFHSRVSIRNIGNWIWGNENWHATGHISSDLEIMAGDPWQSPYAVSLDLTHRCNMWRELALDTMWLSIPSTSSGFTWIATPYMICSQQIFNLLVLSTSREWMGCWGLLG